MSAQDREEARLEVHALHPSAWRPRLLLGVDKRLLVANFAISGSLALMGSKNPLVWLGIACVSGVIFFALRRLCSAEPQVLDIWRQFRRAQQFYPAHARWEAPVPGLNGNKGAKSASVIACRTAQAKQPEQGSDMAQRLAKLPPLRRTQTADLPPTSSN